MMDETVRVPIAAIGSSRSSWYKRHDYLPGQQIPGFPAEALPYEYTDEEASETVSEHVGITEEEFANSTLICK